jgi:hypothetical protein
VVHEGDVPHLGRQPGRHRADRLGHVPPTSGQTRHLGATAQPALGADLAGHPGHLAREEGELVDHFVDGTAQPAEIAPELAVAVMQVDALGQIAAGHRVEHARRVGRRGHQGVEQLFHIVDAGRPAALARARGEPLVQPVVAHEVPADALHLSVEVVAAVHDLVEHRAEFGHQAVSCLGHLAEVAVPGGGHGGEQRTQI